MIGRHARITSSTNPTLTGKEGVITDETKNTITIDDKTFIKDHVTLNVEGDIIRGKDITKTPTERIKGNRP
ncbi:ribonuclease P protein subunit [Candidatus Woesearchaeota archaeon]|nr:ribonuclease P protein subunit [Candidatus Woesearchaeota archaeon]